MPPLETVSISLPYLKAEFERLNESLHALLDEYLVELENTSTNEYVSDIEELTEEIVCLDSIDAEFESFD